MQLILGLKHSRTVYKSPVIAGVCKELASYEKDLGPHLLKWVFRLESFFLKNKYLTQKQMNVLSGILDNFELNPSLESKLFEKHKQFYRVV